MNVELEKTAFPEFFREFSGFFCNFVVRTHTFLPVTAHERCSAAGFAAVV